MRNNKNGLDEMQKVQRNSIGNQMFMLMFYALFIDSGLYGAGIRWLDYPANVMVIIIACMSIYLVRTIASNAYLPPKAQNRKSVISIGIVIVFAIAVGVASYFLFGKSSTQIVETASNNSALILFIASGTGLLISSVVAIIKKVNNDKDKCDE